MKAEPQHVKSIIVGAGCAGLTAAKELHQFGISFLCFDQLASIGGVFARYVYPGMLFTSSTKTTTFSDFPWKHEPTHWTPDQALQYLKDYVDHFGFKEKIKLNSRLDEARLRDDGIWEITVTSWNPGSDAKDVTKTMYTCDHLLLGTGPNGHPRQPALPGIENFKGEMMHSSRFAKDGERLMKGKKVLIIGSGETASDQGLLTAQMAEKVYFSIRQMPAHSATHYPKWFENDVADSYDSRAMYGLPTAISPLAAAANVTRFERHGGDERKQQLFSMAAACNDKGKRCFINSWGCKNFNIFRAMVDHGAERRPGIKTMGANHVEFTDGSTAEIDVILNGSGYELAFPYLEKHHSDIAMKLTKIRDLYKSVIHPDLGDKLMLIGFARPNMTSLWISCELTSRYATAIVAGKVAIPDRKTLVEGAKADERFYRERLGDKAVDSVITLVYCLYFFDTISEAIGCQPPILRMFFTDPRRAAKIVWGSINNCHYRFTGPNADPKAAAECLDTIEFAQRTPFVEAYGG